MNAEAKQPLIDAVPGRHSGDLCFALRGRGFQLAPCSNVLPAAPRWAPFS